jgi:hypothetical protein
MEKNTTKTEAAKEEPKTEAKTETKTEAKPEAEKPKEAENKDKRPEVVAPPKKRRLEFEKHPLKKIDWSNQAVKIYLNLRFLHTYVFDPSELVYYRWLVVISVAVLYNYLFIIGRSSFELLQLYNPILWCLLDYACDVLYLIDIFVRLRTG